MIPADMVDPHWTEAYESTDGCGNATPPPLLPISLGEEGDDDDDDLESYDNPWKDELAADDVVGNRFVVDTEDG
jgi:hypothetical protein